MADYLARKTQQTSNKLGGVQGDTCTTDKCPINQKPGRSLICVSFVSTVAMAVRGLVVTVAVVAVAVVVPAEHITLACASLDN